ncbi:PDZ and LIM domain protein 5b isoform X2 [Denticeps clupeoides]|uniref:PDZ and LIM domain protein 5b isoform X2 n=1 Tax=Denticeps clupeoides TaxID=299321 RepID=UPI0010A36CAF|nr:PDZ and LIM domain protein 5-like isoform X2 [Denticeps clupeoides]
MSSSYNVLLNGPAPWGFRLQGGKDFCMPLTVSKLTDGGKAAKANVGVGDKVLSIDGISTEGMTHLEAQNKIKACTGSLNLTLQRVSSYLKVDTAPKDQAQEIIKPVPIIQPHTAPPGGPSMAYNKTARPFGGGSPVGSISTPVSVPKVASIPSASSAFTPASISQPTPQLKPAAPAAQLAPPRSEPPKASTVNSAFSSGTSKPARMTASPSSAPTVPQPSVYNTPINLYSTQNACEVAMGQQRGLLEGNTVVEKSNGTAQKPQAHTGVEVTHSSFSDSSKKRLVDDTEDWHPRSGTGQSRSFRMLAQMTGTENDQNQESGPAKNEAVEVAQPKSHTTSATRSMTKISGPQNTNGVPPALAKTRPVVNPAGGPKLGGQPSVGRVTGGLPKALERPAPQPHPKDQDSLVQRAEHMPAGTRTPMCGHCNAIIRGPFLVAMGKSWHPEEFNCARCRTSLASVGFVEERGSVYCEHCYEAFFAPVCCHCQQKVLGDASLGLKRLWVLCATGD